MQGLETDMNQMTEKINNFDEKTEHNHDIEGKSSCLLVISNLCVLGNNGLYNSQYVSDKII